MRIQLMNPKGATHQPERRPAARPTSLEGLTIGLLSNQKANAANLLNETAKWFVDRHGCSTLAIENKHDASRPAAPELLHSIAQRSDFLITAAGD